MTKEPYFLGQAFEPVPRLIPLLLSTDLSSCRLARKKGKAVFFSFSVFDFDIGFEFILKKIFFPFSCCQNFWQFSIFGKRPFWKSFEKAPKHQKIGFTLILGFRSKFCGNRNFKRGRWEIRTCSAQKWPHCWALLTLLTAKHFRVCQQRLDGCELNVEKLQKVSYSTRFSLADYYD